LGHEKRKTGVARTRSEDVIQRNKNWGGIFWGTKKVGTERTKGERRGGGKEGVRATREKKKDFFQKSGIESQGKTREEKERPGKGKIRSSCS